MKKRKKTYKIEFLCNLMVERMDGFNGTLWTLMFMDGHETCEVLEKSMEQSRRICLRFSIGISSLPTPTTVILPGPEGCRVVFLSAATIEEVLRRTGYTKVLAWKRPRKPL
ncbi:uncharacterized protein LOC110752534 [Prunus avium]|uniref:Uncharacterized protein LOC110752534 n=1 Tax=Prunus avium TaxID=42229 RepID=A0A6P5S5V8_PRUAV|nr:uncharacterized protein LOC110752534 [Prunus avium]